MTEQIADILDRAAELIDTKGWTQGAFARAEGKHVRANNPNAECFCVAGAIDAACLSENISVAFHSISLFEKYLNIEHLGNVFSWNDDPSRTKEEVVAALKAAAELARKDSND